MTPFVASSTDLGAVTGYLSPLQRTPRPAPRNHGYKSRPKRKGGGMKAKGRNAFNPARN